MCMYTKQTYRNLQEFIARGWLAKDERPSYYIYAQRMGDHLQVRKRPSSPRVGVMVERDGIMRRAQDRGRSVK